ncbi:formylmethanofuran dehydrogenase subunit E region [Methanococcus aeolicus Nankai-3]|uniref:Formylmethanofuran dehydrogenase subunit E region n=1 Tax=Methanococcus aeolicus (strain ATCC BAA-1280 / DSM 17508 / OCM 812 / Nankai-3) TaxID=419665 RepID=A6UT52_META3|nr:FmdE family protein [Methanococcus aeolicus]ABR55674.1 formylmethanofuran dehydrogenase subunit E region [Methanococcus aeolicus Nankai-3]
MDYEAIYSKLQNPELKKQVEKVVDFHTYLSSGALIGVYMFNIAKKLLDFDTDNGDIIYATSETYACLPDAFQALGKCTIGNGKLKVNNTGKMAITVNMKQKEEGENTKGVRIILDPTKTINYPRLHAWYMNLERIPHEEIIPILIDAGDSVYSYEFVDIDVPTKSKKKVILCEICKEPFVKKSKDNICVNCANG